MPELPEAEVIRRDLDTAISGKRIARIEATGARSVRRYNDPAPFVAAVEGRKVVAVSRRGKYLVVALDDGHALVVHLGMSGQLLWSDDAATERKKHTHVVLT